MWHQVDSVRSSLLTEFVCQLKYEILKGFINANLMQSECKLLETFLKETSSDKAEVCKTSTPSSNLGAAFFNLYSKKLFVTDDRVLSIEGEGTRVYESGFAGAVYALVEFIHGDRSGRV